MAGRINIFDSAKRVAEFLGNILFPRRCPYCDGIVTPFGEKIHAKCLAGFKIQASPYCMKCGRKLNSDEKYCSDCMINKHEFKRGRCLYEYSSSASSIYRFKYLGRKEYAQSYGEQAADYLSEFFSEVKADALIPIPIHRRRYAKRGYNQAFELAKSISKHTGIPVMDKVLVRKKHTKALKLLSGSERQKNLKNAFIVRQNSVKLKTIILIDDIYTTGATVDEAARTFKRAGIPDVYFVALAGGKGL